MKKLTMIIGVILMAAVGVNAQKGTTFLYGGAKMSSVSVENTTGSNTTGQLALGIAHNVSNHWTVGIEIDDAGQKVTNSYKNNEFQIGPFVRYTVPFNDTFGFWGQINTHYVAGKNETYNPAATVNSNGFNGAITPAFYVNLGKGFGLNLLFGSLGIKTLKPKNGLTTSTFTAGFGPTDWGIVLSKSIF